MKKRIKILTPGPIRIKGFINGPVLTPYFEETDVIFAMITSGIKVVEVCDDRTEIELTVSNLNVDNSKAAREEREAAMKAKEKATNKNKENEEPKVEESVEVTDDELEVTEMVEESSEANTEEESIIVIDTAEDVNVASDNTVVEASHEQKEPKYNNYNNHNKKNHRR